MAVEAEHDEPTQRFHFKGYLDCPLGSADDILDVLTSAGAEYPFVGHGVDGCAIVEFAFETAGAVFDATEQAEILLRAVGQLVPEPFDLYAYEISVI